MKSLRTYLILLSLGLLIPPLFAQQKDEEPVYDLSPFTISEEETIGYQATTTFSF
ncbi:hypothetical protein F7C95_14105 [Opitutia bacterium ISCC 51]|nr:hypothetical protein F7C95_14105 [Opitutae bacterium ISCC 51]QXD27134.1 hypothetical protein GA003_14020 [Opitutae bacterium ISCC 52]